MLFLYVILLTMNILITSLEGLYVYDISYQRLTLIDNVPCHGVRKRGDRYYLFIHSPFGENFNNPINKNLEYNKGKVISFILNGMRMEDIRDEIDDLDYKTHQIAFMNDDLIIQETYKQQLTVYNTVTGTRTVRNPIPVEKYKYCHMNSVEYYNGKVFILAPYIHSHEVQPKLIILDTSFNILDEIILPGRILHNIRIDGDIVIYICSSCKIYRYDYVKKTVIDTFTFRRIAEKWMRGLIETDDYYIVGHGKTIQRICKETRETEVFRMDTMLFPADLLLL